MITRIEILKNIGKFDEFNWDQDTANFSSYNLIFGYNGSGKSTFSNVFRLFSDKEDDGGEMLFSDLSNERPHAKVVISLDNNKICYSKNCAKECIYVFNSDFVDYHVYSGTNLSVKPFENTVVTDAQLTNPKIAIIENKLEDCKKELKMNNKIKEEFEKEFAEIKKKHSSEFNNQVTGSRMPKINRPTKVLTNEEYSELRKKLDKAYGDYKMGNKQEELNQDIEKIKSLVFSKIKTDIKHIKLALNTNIQRETEQKIKRKIDLLSDLSLSYPSARNWFRDGLLILKHYIKKENYNCPLCDSNIHKNYEIIIKKYHGYFSEAYDKLITQIDNLIKTIEEDIKVINDNNKNCLSDLNQLIDKYRSNAKLIRLDNKEKNIIPSLVEIKSELQNKKDDVSYECMNKFDDFKNINKSYDASIDLATETKNNLSSKLNKFIIDPNKALQSIRTIITQCVYAEADELNEGNQIYKYISSIEKIKELRKKEKKLYLEKDRELSNLKNESKYVNSFLKKLGISHFHINIEDNNDIDNIKIIFKNGNSCSKLRCSLSEGEKTALALAYFFSKVHYEVVENVNCDLANTIIVVDDPVSSLDENRLHSTACLIFSFFQNAKQLFVLSHNIVFMKFLNNVIGYPRNDTDKKLIRQDYYITTIDGLLLTLPAQMQNYSSTYFQRLNELILFRRNKLTYESVKSYLPTYLRTVLETFLSFKFSILTNGSSSSKYKSAGMDRLIKHIKANIGKFSHFAKVHNIDHTTIIDQLYKIKTMTDPQVHGTPRDIDGIGFISEEELRNITKNVIDIISFFDQMHLDQVSRIGHN